MSYSTNWDVDYYKTDYESEEHWELRKRFMEVHKNKFPEDELVCLAQVFTNIEFMGCKYPDETMQLVAQLSQEVAKEFREERSQRLKRTFVRASDAAEARAKGKVTIIEKPNSQKNKNTFNSKNSNKKNLVNAGFIFQAPAEESGSGEKMDLLEGLEFGRFILYLLGDRNCIMVSGQRCGVNVTEKEVLHCNQKEFEVMVDGRLTGTIRASGVKQAKERALEAGIIKLEELSKYPDGVRVNKSKKKIECNLNTTETYEKNKITNSNIGYKMMQKLGWSGSGLGCKNKGRENPVDYVIKNDRKGLGSTNSEALNHGSQHTLAKFIQKRKFEILIGGKLAGTAVASTIKEVKQKAFDEAMKKLTKECYTIALKRNADRIDISKNNQTIKCKVASAYNDEVNKLDQNNIGYKMMQKLGWSGGGLGSKKDGREDPVDYLIKNNRKGLGNTTNEVNTQYFKQMLQNYIESDDIKDLYFESSFTKQERADLHQIANRRNLKSTSHGKEPNRQLVISKKNITPLTIIEEVLLNKNPMYINKYEVTVPLKMANMFPDNARKS